MSIIRTLTIKDSCEYCVYTGVRVIEDSEFVEARDVRRLYKEWLSELKKEIRAHESKMHGVVLDE